MDQKKKKRVCVYKEAYAEEFGCVKKSAKGDSYAFCKLCRADISTTVM